MLKLSVKGAEAIKEANPTEEERLHHKFNMLSHQAATVGGGDKIGWYGLKVLLTAAWGLIEDQHPNFRYENHQFRSIMHDPKKLDLYCRLLAALWSVYRPALAQCRFDETIAHDNEAVDADKLKELLPVLCPFPNLTLRLNS